MSELIEIHRIPEERRMRLTWSDGHTAEFPYDHVRGYCPCAACQGHGAFKIEFHPTIGFHSQTYHRKLNPLTGLFGCHAFFRKPKESFAANCQTK